MSLAFEYFKCYHYEELPTASSIRIIKLLAGEWDDRPRCEMEVCDVEDEPAYEAISYVWGSTNKELSIHIQTDDGSFYLEITENSARALRRFRYSEKSRRLWIDSICINQANYNERSYQVSLIGRIYRGATAVLMWLGEDSSYEETGRACTCMNLLNEASPRVKVLEESTLKGFPDSSAEYKLVLWTQASKTR